MLDFLGNLERTHLCGELRAQDEGKQVTLMGWVHRRRDLGQLIFIDLRDRSGVTQVVFKADVAEEVHRKAEELRGEYVIAVQGAVVKREPATVNKNIETGAIEVVAQQLYLLNESKTVPFPIDDDSSTSEDVRLKYRYLDLRRPRMQHNLKLRHTATLAARNFLSQQGFYEIETPMLTKSTPEGSRDYLVPSRIYHGKFYALPQSPQLFKQILMISNFDRYFQIARCFRDEDLRADRQPEFTQIDLEMSFARPETVFNIVEPLMQAIFRSVGIEIKLPFPRFCYQDVMARYGSDKPDLRFGMEFVDLSSALGETSFAAFADTLRAGGQIKGIRVVGGAKYSRRQVDEFTALVKQQGAGGLFTVKLGDQGLQSSLQKQVGYAPLQKIAEACGAQPGDMLFIVAATPSVVAGALGALRLEIARKENLIDTSQWNFLWVQDFPMFEWSEEEKRWAAVHHPFTHPADDDIEAGWLETDPGRVRAKAYDLVLNGNELGSGSIRIHRPDIQQRVFHALGLSEEEARMRFGFFLEALQYGTPPHGGIALGLDRIVALLAGESSIREVIAFPKTASASCLITDSPTPVTKAQLEDLGIDLKESSE